MSETKHFHVIPKNTFAIGLNFEHLITLEFTQTSVGFSTYKKINSFLICQVNIYLMTCALRNNYAKNQTNLKSHKEIFTFYCIYFLFLL